MGVLREQFEHELDGSVLRIEEAVGPYTRFVRTERKRLEEVRERLSGVEQRLEGVRTALGG